MKRCSGGFTYIWLLMAVAALGIGLARIGVIESREQQRDREQRLLIIGNEFRQAIGSYYNGGPPGFPKTYPRSLEDLVDDRRFDQPRRHLRKVYFDPMTGKPDWGVVIIGGGIAGVHSRVQEKPVQRATFLPVNAHFAAARTYTEWVFSYPHDLSLTSQPTPP